MANSQPEDIQTPESSLPPEMVANLRLKDLGIESSAGGESSYRWSLAFTAMTDAVKLVRSHLGKTPEWFQADMQIRLYNLCKDMDSFSNMYLPRRKAASQNMTNHGTIILIIQGQTEVETRAFIS